MVSIIATAVLQAALTALGAAAPSTPCPVTTPAGFTPAPQQGSWYDPSCPVDPKTGIDPCAKPSVQHRHGVSVECCAELCAADPECQGFQVYEPCGISDCYAYHQPVKSNFTPFSGSHSFAWSGTRPPVRRNISEGCVAPSWNRGFPFTWRCKVAGVAAAPGPPPVPAAPLPGLPMTTTWSLGSSRVTSNGTEWSAEGNFTAADAVKARKWSSIVNHVAITSLSVASLPAPVGTNASLTSVECQVTLVPAQIDEGPRVPADNRGLAPPAPIPVKGLLFGGSLGLMLSMNSSQNPRMSVPVLTMADYNNERYGKVFEGIEVATPPKKFPLLDRCICGDDDWLDWSSCISTLRSLGMSGIGVGPDNAFSAKLLAANGVQYTSDGIYAPPGAEPDTGLTTNASYMNAWAAAQFTRFDAAGFAPTQLKAFALADEPGWYFPAESPEHYMNASLGASAAALKTEWEAFLVKNKVAGLSMPSTDRWQLKDLAAKKLFYWSSRFSSYSAAAAFARATAAIEGATRKGAPIYVNFNNFAGRGYVPGPVANNRDRSDPNAAMGSLDWSGKCSRSLCVFFRGSKQRLRRVWTSAWMHGHVDGR